MNPCNPGSPASRALILTADSSLFQALVVELAAEGYTALQSSPELGPLQACVHQADLVLIDARIPCGQRLRLAHAFWMCNENRAVPVIWVLSTAASADPRREVSLVLDERGQHEPHIPAPPSSSGQGLELDPSRCCVTLHGRPVNLTRGQFLLLACLVRRPGRVFTREQLSDAMHPDGNIVTPRTVDAMIKILRERLGPEDWIETVRGIGYRLRDGVLPMTRPADASADIGAALGAPSLS